MCGIVGYVGQREPLEVVISGLHRLEYRGYDSAGVAFLADNKDRLDVVKSVGKMHRLDEEINRLTPSVTQHTTAIGHTRWATHGEPNQRNAHPHLSEDKRFAIVHNGIIENYSDLKNRLIREGFTFKSDTDSEVIAQLIQHFYKDDLRDAVAETLKLLHGTYGICVLSSEAPDMLIAARKGSPIVVGVGSDETIVASDVSAIINYTNQVIYLNDGEVVVADGNTVEISSLDNIPITREPEEIPWNAEELTKGGYEHYMLKEVHEQPDALANATRGRLIESDGTTKLSGTQMTPQEMAEIDRFVIAACGTSYYAGMVGKYYFEDFAGIPTEIEQAAEFRYRNPIIQRGTCMIALSQSGETADTLAAVREALCKGSKVLGICNSVGSTIAREAGRGIYLHAGPEIGVASTKAFTCQVAVLAMLAIAFARTRRLSNTDGRQMIQELKRLPELAERTLEYCDHIAAIAEKYAHYNDYFYIGRGYMFPVALEGALKLKEISYIHAEGYHAAELKHGPIALLCDQVPVVAVAPMVPGRDKTISNMQECKARKSPVIAIATEGDDEILPHCDDVIRIPACAPFLSPIPAVIAEQVFAYHVARLRGCAIDQPRNLAKSVTVE